MPDKKTGIEKIFEGEGFDQLSEDVRAKAEVIFGAAVSAQVSDAEAALVEAYDAKLVEATAALAAEMEEKVNDYLTYATKEWMSENKLAVERGIQTEISESFLVGMKSLFDEHYIEVPENKVDLVAEMAEEQERLEGQLDEAVKAQIASEKVVVGMKRAKIVSEATAKLADTETEKVEDLLTHVDFVNEEAFAAKVAMIVETYFGKDEAFGKDDDEDDDDKKKKDDDDDDDDEMDEKKKKKLKEDAMARYMVAIGAKSTF